MAKLTRDQILQIIKSARGRGETPELIGADLKETELLRVKLRGAELSEAELLRARFSGAELLGMDLSGMDLHERCFSQFQLDFAGRQIIRLERLFQAVKTACIRQVNC